MFTPHQSRKTIVGLILGTAITTAVWAANPATRPASVYGDGDESLLNRVHAGLFVRTGDGGRDVGEDELDPLLWYTTSHLVLGPSHKQAIQLLDELIATPVETISPKPIERAILQHDLWAIFDWADKPWQSDGRDQDNARQALRRRLATAIRHVALTDDDIARLPDNYAAAVASKAFAAKYDRANPKPFLPPDLLDPAGPWVCVTNSLPLDEPPVMARVHMGFFEGRSAFLVFINLPGGRQATCDYLETVSQAPKPTTQPANRRRGFPPILRDHLPQFPAGTQVALLRQMFLLNDHGRLVPSPLTQSLQIRAYREVRDDGRSAGRAGDQDFFEFTLSRKLLFTGPAGGLRAIGPDELTLQGLMGIPNGRDYFEDEEPRQIPKQKVPVMQTCLNCHSSAGIYSVNSFTGFGAPNPDPELHPCTDQEEIARAIFWKIRQHNFGLLQGLNDTKDR